MASYKKDPNAVLDYTFDWSAWLAPIVDSISTAVFTLTGGLVQVSKTNTATTATIFVSGGTVGTPATISCRITTAGGRTEDRTIKLTVIDR